MVAQGAIEHESMSFHDLREEAIALAQDKEEPKKKKSKFIQKKSTTMIMM